MVFSLGVQYKSNVQNEPWTNVQKSSVVAESSSVRWHRWRQVMGGGGASCALQTHNSNAPLARRHNGCLTDISISGPPFSHRRKNEDETARRRTWRRGAPGDGNTQTPAILLSTAFINFRGGPPGAGKTITRLIRFQRRHLKFVKQDGEKKQNNPPPKKNPNLPFV